MTIGRNKPLPFQAALHNEAANYAYLRGEKERLVLKEPGRISGELISTIHPVISIFYQQDLTSRTIGAIAGLNGIVSPAIFDLSLTNSKEVNTTALYNKSSFRKALCLLPAKNDN